MKDFVRQLRHREARGRSVIGLLMVMLLLVGHADRRVCGAETVDFGRDIYPVLQRACFECHGARKQEADLRLDQREFAFRDRSIIAAGQSAQSELVRRISLPAGHDEVMPSRGKPLTPVEIAMIKSWIDAGAEWPEKLQPVKHWAYEAPRRRELPEVPNSEARVRNLVDAWVVKRLQQEGLSFSKPADKATLIRRLSLDLIGLPPTPAELDAFVKDSSPESTERLIDRLLQSPQFGVRWARPWLDYARYADSHGFQRDDFRDLWPYRDWVVNALNADMPFTQFTIEQLAGDLLPNATEAQLVATGFNRSAPTNVEAGSDPEETRVNQVHDRVNTLGMVWLGTTLECAQCHDHKYDPITQRDYYGLFAFFNNTSLEADRTNPRVPGSIQFKGPVLELADTMSTERSQLKKRVEAINASLAKVATDAAEGLPAWESALQREVTASATEHVVEISEFESSAGSTHEVLADQSVLLSGEPAADKDTYSLKLQTQLVGIRGLKIEALSDESLPGKGPGRGDEKRPNFVLNNVLASVAPLKDPKAVQRVTFTGARASFSQANLPATSLLKTNNDAKSGWAISPKFHQSHWVVLEPSTALGFEGGTVLTLKLEQNFGGGRTIGRVRVVAITGDASKRALPTELVEALAVPSEKRSAKQKQVVLSARLKEVPEQAQLEREKLELETQLRSFKSPSTLVMREDTLRASVVFQRGDFRSPGERVDPATPSILHPLSRGPRGDSRSAATRLDLAQWLVSRENPLVARVVVNRWWAEIFGHGLVTTLEDFGIKGDRPTHPELLDALAIEFMDQGWSQKKLLKTIVMSSTYQQSAQMTEQLLAQDDRNRLYARGPRQRLEAELIRDNSLAVAGLLNLQLGGPPIRPYQPDGLWVKVGGQKYDYEVSPGNEKYRRGLYVVLKRGAPYPSFVNFDANNRMACRVNRPKSNTPLQALALMNDPVYVEAAHAFARRVLVDASVSDDASRIQLAFRIALSRSPRPEELKILSHLLDAERRARADSKQGTRQGTGTGNVAGAVPVPDGVSAIEFAAWTAVTATLLNLDECITKG